MSWHADVEIRGGFASLLLLNGAEPDAPDRRHGLTALHYACRGCSCGASCGGLQRIGLLLLLLLFVFVVVAPAVRAPQCGASAPPRHRFYLNSARMCAQATRCASRPRSNW